LIAADPVLDWAIQQWKREPQIRIEDAYKWLFHATLGGEHAVHDLAMVRDWLHQEWRGLSKPLKGESLFLFLTPDRKLVRLNLRPYKAMGGTEASVLRMFVQSAKAFKADRKSFVREWTALGERLRAHPLGYLRWSEWTRLDRDTRPKGYPAIDHSAEYEEAARPAYRVVLDKFLEVRAGKLR